MNNKYNKTIRLNWRYDDLMKSYVDQEYYWINRRRKLKSSLFTDIFRKTADKLADKIDSKIDFWRGMIRNQIEDLRCRGIEVVWHD